MVQEGFGAWQAFHERFADRQRDIRQQDPGLATWSDVARFLAEYGNVETREGFKALRFMRSGDRVDPLEQPVAVVSLGGPQQYVATVLGSTPLGLEEAHRELKISPAEFDEVAAELARTLDVFQVPEREKGEVLGAFAAHKDEVTRGSTQ